ncbi:MAG TPA: type I-MYXAN CRISPR-associated protein Cas6/Cmx6 [Pyrinomonadaceae bacterium]
MIDALEARVPQSNLRPCINVSFSLSGKQLPADHGYLVYSAISRSISSLHGIDWLAIELISGFPSGRGLIALPERDATLRLRIPAGHYRDVLPLAGKRLDIGGHQIRLGLPVARPLEPAPSLYARVVTIKKFTEAQPFIEAVKRKLGSFGVKGRIELPRDEQGRYRRRIVTIHGKSVVGFSVAVHDLNDEDSLLLQAGAVKVVSPDDGATQWQSIFSRRAMGCGIFNPVKRQVQSKEVE